MTPQEEGKKYMVLGNSFMIAFPPTFDFSNDQVTFRVNPNAPPDTMINVIKLDPQSKWKFVLYFLVAFFLILLVAGVLITIINKKPKK